MILMADFFVFQAFIDEKKHTCTPLLLTPDPAFFHRRFTMGFRSIGVDESGDGHATLDYSGAEFWTPCTYSEGLSHHLCGLHVAR